MAVPREPGEESPARKVFLVCASVVFAFFTSGAIFGYSGLYKVLVFDVKAFAELCPAGQPLPCDAQNDSLTLMYTIGATTISGCAFFVGMFLDHFGPRITACAGSAIFAGGLAALGAAAKVSSNLYYVGFFGMALGGPCIFNAMMNFGELYPRQSAAVIAALNGAFDASAVVMFLVGQAVDSWQVPFHVALSVYMLVPAVIFLTALYTFPDRPYGADGGPGSKGELFRVWNLAYRKQATKASDLAGAELAGSATSAPLLEKRDRLAEGPHSDIFNTDFGTQLRSGVFWSMAVVTAFLVLRVNFYIASIFDQLLYTAEIFSPERAVEAATEYTALFNWILPLGGVVMVPFVGYALVELGLGPSFFLIAVFNLAFSLTSTLNWLPLKYQVIGFAAYSASRPFIFGAMAAYIGRLFGFRNFGKLYGVTRVMGALFTSASYPLATLTKSYLGGDYYYVNAAFVVVGCLLFIFPVYLVKKVFYGFTFRPREIDDPSLDSDPTVSRGGLVV